MPRKVELEKVTLNLRKGDKEILQKFYHKVGWSTAVRQIVGNVCDRLSGAEQNLKSAKEAINE